MALNVLQLRQSLLKLLLALIVLQHGAFLSLEDVS